MRFVGNEWALVTFIEEKQLVTFIEEKQRDLAPLRIHTGCACPSLRGAGSSWPSELEACRGSRCGVKHGRALIRGCPKP